MVRFFNDFIHRWEWLRARSLHTWWACSRANPWSSTAEERRAKVDSRRAAALASSTSGRALPAPPGLWRWAVCEYMDLCCCHILKGHCVEISASHLSACVPSDRGLCFQSEHQRCVCAEIPQRPVCLAGRWCQWWGDGGCQARGGLPGWQCQPGVRGQGARWVSSEDQYTVCHTTRGRTNY